MTGTVVLPKRGHTYAQSVEARNILQGAYIALVPERFHPGVQARVLDDPNLLNRAFTPDNPREWDSETIEWATTAIEEALDVLGGDLGEIRADAV